MRNCKVHLSPRDAYGAQDCIWPPLDGHLNVPLEKYPLNGFVSGYELSEVDGVVMTETELKSLVGYEREKTARPHESAGDEH